MKSDREVNNTLALFLGDRHDIKQRLVARLNEIRWKLDRSHYFKTHEVSSSSLTPDEDRCCSNGRGVFFFFSAADRGQQYFGYLRRRQSRRLADRLRQDEESAGKHSAHPPTTLGAR